MLTITQKQYNDLKQLRRVIVRLDKEIDKTFNTASAIVDDTSDDFYDVMINGDSLDKYLSRHGIKVEK